MIEMTNAEFHNMMMKDVSEPGLRNNKWLVQMVNKEEWNFLFSDTY